jgi:hypothetical protein
MVLHQDCSPASAAGGRARALIAIRGWADMLTLMKKGPWGKAEEDDPSALVAYEEFRRYRELTHRYHERIRQEQEQAKRQQRRERLMRQWIRPGSVALGSAAAIWVVASYGPVLGSLLSSDSSPSVAQVRSYSSFRSCADARAAGATPLIRGQSGYSSHLDADGDGIACEWSWQHWFR